MKERKRTEPVLIDIKTLNIIFNIFNTCYKAGVMDAEDIGDAEMYASFEREVSVPGVYGRINSFERYDINGWRIMLLQMLFKNSDAHKKFLIRAEINKDFINCVFPISLEFYLMGIRDFNTYPTIHDFSLFDNTKFQRWTRKGIVKVSRSDMFVYVQSFGFRRSQIDFNNKRPASFPKKRYETFMQRLWLAMDAINKGSVL